MRVIELSARSSMGYGYRGESLLCMGRYEEAMTDLTLALELGPNDPYVHAAMAWLLVAGPSDMRDPQRAVGLAEVGSKSARPRNLGAAYFRLGRFQEANDMLTRAIATETTGAHTPAETWLFLAMVSQTLGEQQEAREWFNRAEAWIRDRAGPDDALLRSVRDEAATLLATDVALPISPRKDNPAGA